MKKLCAIILFYLVIGCLSTSVYAELYMWTDEKGIKHFSNTTPNEQGKKNIEQKGEIKFDEAKHQEIIEQQKARVQAEANQKRTPLKEENGRELRKKFVRDTAYGNYHHMWGLPPLQNPPPPLPESSVMQEQKMKKMVKDAVEDAVREGIANDRLMHGRPYKSRY